MCRCAWAGGHYGDAAAAVGLALAWPAAPRTDDPACLPPNHSAPAPRPHQGWRAKRDDGPLHDRTHHCATPPLACDRWLLAPQSLGWRSAKFVGYTPHLAKKSSECKDVLATTCDVVTAKVAGVIVGDARPPAASPAASPAAPPAHFQLCLTPPASEPWSSAHDVRASHRQPRTANCSNSAPSSESQLPPDALHCSPPQPQPPNLCQQLTNLCQHTASACARRLHHSGSPAGPRTSTFLRS